MTKARGDHITVIKCPGLGCWRADSLPIDRAAGFVRYGMRETASGGMALSPTGLRAGAPSQSGGREPAGIAISIHRKIGKEYMKNTLEMPSV